MRQYAAPPPSRPQIYLGHIPKGYLGTKKTVEHIKALIRAGAKDFYVRQKAIDILLEQGIKPKDYLGEIEALFKWVQRNVRYTKDPFQVEVLHSARRMLELRAGDCDDLTILLGAMLKAIGHPVRLTLAGFHPHRPRLFSHIYLEVSYKGHWIPLDPTMPYSMGWAPPAAYRQIFHIEKESNMIGMTDEELQGLMNSGVMEGMSQPPDLLMPTVDGLGNIGLSRRLRRNRATTTPLPWLRDFVIRMWRGGVQRRDPQIRSLYRVLSQQRRLGRGTRERQFLNTAYRQGIQARDPQLRQFIRQLREWGLLPQRVQPPYPGARSGLPEWYQRPPWWYTQPPPWYRGAGISPIRVFPPRPTLPGVPASPFRVLPSVARLPGQAVRTATSALTAPGRFLTRLFR